MQAGTFVLVSWLSDEGVRLIIQGVVIKDYCDGTIGVYVAEWGFREVLVMIDDLEVAEPEPTITGSDLDLY